MTAKAALRGCPARPDGRRRSLESLVRADYERCRPDDSFDDLKRRARFAKEDKGLLRDWLAVGEWREPALLANTNMITAE